MASTTPEGKVKEKIDAVLEAAPFCRFDKPVVSPYGKAMLDYIGCSKGRYFEIEAKRAGKEPTARQEARMKEVLAAGGNAFFIDGENGQLEALDSWLNA